MRGGGEGWLVLQSLASTPPTGGGGGGGVSCLTWLLSSKSCVLRCFAAYIILVCSLSVQSVYARI